MRARLGALLVAAIVSPALASPAAGQAVPADGAVARARLVSLVAAVQDADYRGDLGRLRLLAGEMQPFATDLALAGAARYWRGFAHWRHALNSLNDGAPPDSVDADFAAAIIEFREALRIDPSDVEAQIGLSAGLANRAFFNMGAPEGAAFMAEYVPLLQAIRRKAPDNPRMMFVAAASLFWAPPDRGGDREAALSMLERGIRLAESSPANADPLVASWGEAELHMLLAWFSLNVLPPQGSRALRHAEAALALRPHWRYVRDILIPQIRQRGGAESGRTMSSVLTTLAYRVHRMPAMLAFYSDAFGVQFREVDTGGGIVSRFGELNGITLKFVPIRDAVDFEGFPIHQPGFEVSDVAAVLTVARKHGGSVQNDPVMRDGRLHAAVRDPDGNTIELYGRR